MSEPHARRGGRYGSARLAAVMGTACFVTLGSCAPSDVGRWAGTRTDSAGVVLVANPDVGVWDASGGWRVVEELRIGSFSGDLAYQFGQVGTIALGSGGEIYVSDRQVRQVRVFSADGRLLRSVGGPGSGPGELSVAALDLFVSPGDTLLVPDNRNRRIHRFGPGGEVLASTPLDPERERLLRSKWNRATRWGVTQLRPTTPDGESSGSDRISLVEPSGELGRTLLEVPSGGLLGAGGRLNYFTPEPQWTVTDSLTVVYAINDAYRISHFDAAGRLRRVVSKAFEPRPIGERDIRAFFAYLDRAWMEAGASPAQLERNRFRVSFAQNFPVFSGLEIGYRGSLWVQAVQSPADLSDEALERYNFVEDFGGPRWDVFDAEGRYLGVVTMPPRFQPRLFDGDVIYGVQRDELDVQYVVRLRVVDPEGADDSG